jgi:hypothetical protein
MPSGLQFHDNSGGRRVVGFKTSKDGRNWSCVSSCGSEHSYTADPQCKTCNGGLATDPFCPNTPLDVAEAPVVRPDPAFDPPELQVGQTPCWPRSWPRCWPRSWPTSAFYRCILTGRHGPTCTFYDNLTPASLQYYRARPWRYGDRWVAAVYNYAPSPLCNPTIMGCHGPHMGTEWWVQSAGQRLANHSAWQRPYAWQRFWRTSRVFGPHRTLNHAPLMLKGQVRKRKRKEITRSGILSPCEFLPRIWANFSLF